ncbi:hypothetical protein ACWM9A_06160 [Acetobacter pasteurianus]
MSSSKNISLSFDNIGLLKSLNKQEVANSILGNANNLKALEAKTYSALDADFFCGYRPLCKSFLTNIDV